MRQDLIFLAAISGDNKQFSGVAYSGGLIPAYGHYGDAAIDLATLSTPPKSFALLDHDPRRRAGVATFEVVNGQLLTRGHLLDNDHGVEVASIARQGGPWQLSVGITSDVQKSNGVIKINGVELSPTIVFANAKIREVSFVTAGADPQTNVQVFAHADVELELAELRHDQILMAYPHATAEQAAVIGALPRAAFAAVMALAKKPAVNPDLFKTTAPVGKAPPTAPDGVDPARYALNLRASAIAAETKCSYLAALKLAYAEVENAHAI